MPEVRSHQKRSIRSRLIPLIVLAAILPALLVGVILITQVTRNRERLALARLSGADELLRGRLADSGARTDSILATLTYSLSQQFADPVALRGLLERALAGQPALDELVLLDANGSEIEHASDGPRVFPTSRAEWVRRPEWAAAAGEKYTGMVFTGPKGLPNLSKAVPVRNGEGGIEGILVGRVTLDELWKLVDGVRFGKTGHAYVVDRGGRLIAHPNHSLALSKMRLSRLPIVRRALRGETPRELFRSDRTEEGEDGEYVMVAGTVSNLGWATVVEQEEEEALALQTESLVAILLITLGLVAVFTMVAMKLVAGIIRPIKELQHGAEIIGRGDYDYRLSIHTGDETEELANEFNRMAARVRSSHEDLTSLNRIGQEILTKLTPDEIWQAVCDGTCRLTGAGYAFAVALEAEVNDGIRYVAAAGVNLGECESPPPRATTAFVERVLREGTPIRVQDVRLERELDAVMPGTCKEPTRALLWVPMLEKGRKVVGGILVAHSEPGYFTAREEQLVVTLASEAAAGLEKARLFHQVEEERQNLQVIFDSMAEGVLVLGQDARITYANQFASGIIDRPIQEIVGSKDSLAAFGLKDLEGHIVPAAELPGVHALQTGEVYAARQMMVSTPSQGVRTISVSGAPLRGPGGIILGAVVTFRDITNLKEAEEEVRRALEAERRSARELASVTNVVQALIATLDLNERLRIAAQSLADAVGVQRCNILLVEGDHLIQVMAHGSRPGDEELWRLLPKHISDFKPTSYFIEALQQPHPIIIRDIQNDPRTTTALPRLLDMVSILLMPMVHQGQAIGFALIDEPGQSHEFTEREVRLAMAIAGQAGAIFAESRALEQAETRAAELDALFNVARAVVSVLDLNGVLDAIVDQTMKVMKVDAIALMLINEQEQGVEFRAWRGLSEEHTEKSRLQIGDGIAGRVAMDGLTRTSLNIQADPDYRLRDVVRREGLHSMLSVAINVRQQVIGVINLFTREAREFAPGEIALVTAIGSLAGTAIRNATVYERERHIAETLQTSLLPDELPDLPGIRLGYRYEPAGAEARVGGDFYDFFQLPDGNWGLMVGDVSGHGVEAAINTALAKYALRAYAYENPDPRTVLVKLNEAVSRQMELGTFITLLYAVLDPGARTLRISNAGHPFGIHYRAQRNLCESLNPGGMAVGVMPDQDYLEELHQLDSGDILLLFTDGVTEAGPSYAMLGFEGVTELVMAHCQLGAQEIAEAIYERVKEVSGAVTTDDVALLVLKAV